MAKEVTPLTLFGPLLFGVIAFPPQFFLGLGKLGREIFYGLPVLSLCSLCDRGQSSCEFLFSNAFGKTAMLLF